MIRCLQSLIGIGGVIAPTGIVEDHVLEEAGSESYQCGVFEGRADDPFFPASGAILAARHSSGEDLLSTRIGRTSVDRFERLHLRR